jgi:hypothetical protein
MTSEKKWISFIAECELAEYIASLMDHIEQLSNDDAWADDVKVWLDEKYFPEHEIMHMVSEMRKIYAM